MAQIVNLRKKVNKKNEVPVVRAVPTSSVTPILESRKRIEWSAPSYYYNPQKRYLVLITIGLLCGAGALLFFHQDILTAIFLVLSSLVLILYANKKPALSNIIVNRAGVTIDDYTYYYKELKSFWLDYSPYGPKELSLEAKKWYMPYVKVPIENQNPVEIRSLMINFINEREHEKSLVDLISRKIGL